MKRKWFNMKKFQNWNVGCAAFVERFWFDRIFTNFLVWKLTNFDEWKCVSLLWEMNSYKHCFSHPKVYIRGWYWWLFPCEKVHITSYEDLVERIVEIGQCQSMEITMTTPTMVAMKIITSDLWSLYAEKLLKCGNFQDDFEKHHFCITISWEFWK
jgi:hypothetical protein